MWICKTIFGLVFDYVKILSSVLKKWFLNFFPRSCIFCRINMFIGIRTDVTGEGTVFWLIQVLSFLNSGSQPLCCSKPQKTDFLFYSLRQWFSIFGSSKPQNTDFLFTLLDSGSQPLVIWNPLKAVIDNIAFNLI